MRKWIWDVIFLAWLDEMLRNFLWVPLTSYAKQLDLDSAFLGTLFALNVGARFFPNLLVSQMGSRSELPLMIAVCVGYSVAFYWPAQQWALCCLAVCGGLGFVRPCVTLHAQAACLGDVDSLSEASRWCGAARTCADVCGYILPALAFDLVGWSCVTGFGCSLALAYIVVAFSIHFRAYREEQEDVVDCAAPQEEFLIEKGSQAPRTPWIDWVVSAAFVSTELQWNLLNSAVPAALVHSFGYPTTAVGSIVGVGSLVTLAYLLALPRLPKAFNHHRPLNLLITYSGMSIAWFIMLFSVEFIHISVAFVVGSYLFLAMANASQIVILECLTGVCNLEQSTRIMGISEMAGCVFGMAGSFLGEGFRVYGISVPFIVAGHFSVFSTGILAVSLGSRRNEITQNLACATSAALDEATTTKVHGHFVTVGSALGRSLFGLRHIFRRTESYISEELSYRAAALPTSDLTDSWPLLDPAESSMNSLDTSTWTCSTIKTQIPEANATRGRHMKRLASGFGYAFIELDANGGDLLSSLR